MYVSFLPLNTSDGAACCFHVEGSKSRITYGLSSSVFFEGQLNIRLKSVEISQVYRIMFKVFHALISCICAQKCSSCLNVFIDNQRSLNQKMETLRFDSWRKDKDVACIVLLHNMEMTEFIFQRFQVQWKRNGGGTERGGRNFLPNIISVSFWLFIFNMQVNKVQNKRGMKCFC